MPLYATECQKCGALGSVFRRVADRDNGLTCDECDGPAVRVLSAPMIAADCFNTYISPGTGKLISSPGARNEDLKRSGAILAEPGIEKDVARNKERRLEESFAPIASGVDNVVSQLVAQQKLSS